MNQQPGLLQRVSDYVDWWAKRSPNAEAAVFGGRRWTYAELSAEVDALARALLAAGVRKGDRVATLQAARPEFLIAFLATTSIGAIWVGLNPKYQRAELEHVIGDSQPRVLLTRTSLDGRDYADDIEALRAASTLLERVVVFEGEPLFQGAEDMASFLRAGDRAVDLEAAKAASGGREPCLIVYTSGSTGSPKGALLHHEGVAGFALEQNRIWPTDPSRYLNYFPINHIGCVVDLSVPALVGGGAIVFMEQFEVGASLALMEQERITVWGSVPSAFQMQLPLVERGDYDLSAVQLIAWGGAAMPQDLIRRLLALGAPLATNYSMTEATGITAVAPTDDVEILAETVGHPIAGVEIRLVDASGDTVNNGDAGEVLVRSPYLLLGYWNRPDASREALTPDGFFRTGDLAVRRADGRYRLVGRLTEMFKSGGYNVYPREIEIAIESHPAVDLAAVVPAPDPVWQEVGIAFVAPRSQVTADDLQSWCRERLANYKVPKRFVIQDNLPLLPIGKVDKSQLKRIAAIEP